MTRRPLCGWRWYWWLLGWWRWNHDRRRPYVSHQLFCDIYWLRVIWTMYQYLYRPDFVQWNILNAKSTWSLENMLFADLIRRILVKKTLIHIATMDDVPWNDKISFFTISIRIWPTIASDKPRNELNHIRFGSEKKGKDRHTHTRTHSSFLFFTLSNSTDFILIVTYNQCILMDGPNENRI